ncbi:hypothetical protein HOLleu_20002 [Holothuria leucospilota]|uniref:Uncharacterized protein n=1 Tax=Holothuria leucospilota TaxID=206669 RepID=A0A9Q1C0S8_HOLLE|nr:hypothetical protein HOLleu_20002 [Holothuria leucospilota]
MIIDCKLNCKPDILSLTGSDIERVNNYKYLGVYLGNSFSWKDHIDFLIKNLNVRMYCMRKLHSFYVSPEILSVFYNSVICSVWRYRLLAWGGNISQCEKDRLNRLIKRASRIIGTEQTGVGDTYRALLPQKLHTVWTDVSHPLHNSLS